MCVYVYTLIYIYKYTYILYILYIYIYTIHTLHIYIYILYILYIYIYILYIHTYSTVPTLPTPSSAGLPAQLPMAQAAWAFGPARSRAPIGAERMRPDNFQKPLNLGRALNLRSASSYGLRCASIYIYTHISIYIYRNMFMFLSCGASYSDLRYLPQFKGSWQALGHHLRPR